MANLETNHLHLQVAALRQAYLVKSRDMFRTKLEGIARARVEGNSIPEYVTADYEKILKKLLDDIEQQILKDVKDALLHAAQEVSR